MDIIMPTLQEQNPFELSKKEFITEYILQRVPELSTWQTPENLVEEAARVWNLIEKECNE